MHKATPAH
jgi:hypothetical protein